MPQSNSNARRESELSESPVRPLIQITLEDGLIVEIQTAAGSVDPIPFPEFVIREYDKHGLDLDHFTDLDEAGRPYYEHGLEMTTDERSEDPHVCGLFVASTAHVTDVEAELLTRFNYTRGDTGWLLYVGEEADDVLPELGQLSDGLQGLIQAARRRGCQYLLMDRDALSVDHVPTYRW